jgi:CTP synthase (UTP-ammonia lyase)
MNSIVRIALVGDYSPDVIAHRAIPRALDLAAGSIDCQVEPAWIATPELDRDAEQRLAGFHAIWCVPASPYASMDGALAAIRFARERAYPFLGTCGGFQHALIEYARNALGFAEADHAESNPDATMPLIAPLACSLAETTGTIVLHAGSRISAIYGRATVVEGFNCTFGVNPQYRALLSDGALHITGVDENGEARVVELAEHPFFIATLFQPERSALRGVVHPLIAAYLQAAAQFASRREPAIVADSRR